MTEEEKLIKMFKDVYGNVSRSFDLEPAYEDYGNDCFGCDIIGVNMTTISDCGTRTIIVATHLKVDILFDYITKEW